MLLFIFRYRATETENVQVRANYLKALEDRLKQLETERRLFPQQILTKLKEMDDHLNGIVYKNRQFYELVQFLVNERKSQQNEIKILQKLCVDHDEMARKYLRAKKFHHALIQQKHYLMILLHTLRKNNPEAIVDDLTTLRSRKTISFKSVSLAIVAIMRMKIISQNTQMGSKKINKCILNSLN